MARNVWSKVIAIVSVVTLPIVLFAANTKITITHPETKTEMGAHINAATKHELINQVINYLQALRSGFKNGSMDVQVGEGDAVAASGTYTFATTANAGDTVVIAGTTLTAVNFASTPSSSQFNVGSTAALDAAALVTAITANTTIAAYVTAVRSSSAVTVTAKYKGLYGNKILTTESTSGTRIKVSGASLTGGSEATANSYSFGY